MSKLLRSAPVLLVADVQRSAVFYRDKLGFACSRIWGEPPCFAMPARDGLIVILSQVPAVAPVDTEWRAFRRRLERLLLGRRCPDPAR